MTKNFCQRCKAKFHYPFEQVICPTCLKMTTDRVWRFLKYDKKSENRSTISKAN